MRGEAVVGAVEPALAEVAVADRGAGDLAGGAEPAAVVRAHPESPTAWAALAQQAHDAGAEDLTVYAYARVGYHRSLDQLRKAGWRGQGPVPWSHEPNRGFLRALHALGVAIHDLYALPRPVSPRTTLNVGLASGGTSVNSIAGSADLLLDLRSLDPQALDELDARAQGALHAAAREGEPLDHEALPRRIVEIVYADVDEILWPAAELSVRAQLAYLHGT